MDLLQIPNCASPDSDFNTGIPLCDLLKGRIHGVIYADKGVVFTPADRASVASLVAAIKAKTIAARGGRVYPIWDLLNFEDNTGDPATGSVGNLSTATIVTSDAVPAFRFGYGGGELRHARMASMIGGSYDVFFVDDQFALYGTVRGVNLGGFTVLQNYVYASKFTVSDAVNKYSFRITLSSITEYRDLARFVVGNSTMLTAVGLINVVLSQLSSSTNVQKIQAIADGGSNMATLYGSTIAGLTWSAKNLETSATFTITSVAYDSALAAFTVTMDSTAWTALGTGDRVQISFPTTAALSGASVKPYEGLSVIVVK